jgi:hypothetical protein
VIQFGGQGFPQCVIPIHSFFIASVSAGMTGDAGYPLRWYPRPTPSDSWTSSDWMAWREWFFSRTTGYWRE